MRATFANGKHCLVACLGREAELLEEKRADEIGELLERQNVRLEAVEEHGQELSQEGLLLLVVLVFARGSVG